MNILLTMLLMVSNVFAQNELTPDQQEYLKKSSAYNASYARALKDLVILTSEARQNDLMCEAGTYAGDITKNAIEAINVAMYADYEGKTVFNEIVNIFESNAAVMEAIGNKFSYREAKIQLQSPFNADWTMLFRKAIVGSQFHSSGEGAYGSTKRITFLSETKVLVEEAELLDVEPWIKWNAKEVTMKIEVKDQIYLNFNGETYRLRWTTFGDGQMLVPSSIPDNKLNEAFEGVYFETASECEA